MAVGTTNYPTSLDTVVELVEAANNAADTLSAGISAGDTSLTLTDAAEFAASGIVAIENELLSYTGKSGSTLTGLTRGIEGTTAASHSSGADVRQVITAASHNVQSAAIIALEQKLGTGTDIAWSQMSPLTANRLVVTDGAGDVTASSLTHDATNAVIGNIGGLDFDTTPTATPTTARMVWDDTHGTVNLTLKGGTVGVDIGQTTVARVVNKTVTNINLLRSNYQVVRIVTAQGQRLAISLAQGNSEPNSTDVIGLVAEDIANNQEGFIVARGLITEINTTGSLQGETWADGDILYLSPTTAGGLTKVEPQAPNHLIIVGYVVYAHSQHGKIYVAIQTSWETKELHDVKITGTPVAGSLLIRNATTGVWENATLTAGSNITITNADKSITIAATGSGDVVGPSSATDNALARFDTTTGKLIQNSLITLSDAGALSFPDGVRQTFNPNGTNAGINVGAHTSDPSSPTNGDLWYNSTANQLKTRRGAATEVVATIPSNLGDEIPVLNATTGNLSATGEVFWDGSGNALQIGNASTGALRLVNTTGTDSFTLLPPASGGAVTLTLPPGIGSNGQALTSNGTGGTSWTTITAGVSSVSGTSPVVSSGGSTPAISLASGYGDTQNPYASKTANHFLAAPNGTAGAPTFRAIIAADIPTLNQNTTGTASNVTGTVAIANGGTGATTAPNALTNLGAYPASNPNGYTSNTGTVTSVGGTGTVNGITLTGSVSTTGNLTLGGTLSGVSLTTQVTGTLPVANGGTGVTTSTGTGSVVLSSSPTLVTPSLGTATGTSFNGITGLSSTLPVGDTPGGSVGTATAAARADHAHPVSGVTTISGGTTGLTPSTATSGAVTLAGTLGVVNGGTGATTATDARTNLGAAAVTSSVVPSADSGTGSIGTSPEAARADHVHPAGASGGVGNGFKNYLMNGDFRMAQRGTIINSTSARAVNNDGSYTLDRWYLLSDGNNIATVAQSTTTPTPGLNSMALQVVTSAKKFGVVQVVESINCYPTIGQTVTFSFKARVSATANISNVKAAIISWTGTADSITRDIVSSWNAAGTSPTLVANWTIENTATPVNLNITTSWATYSVTGPVDTANAKNVGVFIWCDALPAATGDSLFIADTQLEVGSTATFFEILPLQIQEQMCFRYYESINNDGGIGATMTGVGYCKSISDPAGDARLDFPYNPFKVKKRITPTMTSSAGSTFGADAAWLTIVSGNLTGNGATLTIWTTTSFDPSRDSFAFYLRLPNASWNALSSSLKFQVGAVGYAFARITTPVGGCFINANAEL